MSEQEQTHAELIECIIGNKMKPIYWMMGAMLTIFVTIAAPITIILINTTSAVQSKAESKDVEAMWDKSDRTYLKKLSYYQIEKDEHKMILEVFRNPALAAFVFDQINSNIAEELDFKYTIRGEKNKTN